AEGAKALPAISLDVALPDGICPSVAYIKTPEREGKTMLDIKVKNGRAEIEIPGGIFSGYALVAVE
ncbi:MAG: hypothetical protein IJ299_00415, partial [Oscillospiraceae bacterium]|nr:hypothetical protein [Oscillospiraceae bacterium]